MLKIRLQRIGRKNNPSYRVVVIEAAMAAKKGTPVEVVGVHDTVRKSTSLNEERIKHWMSIGAQASDTVHNLLIKNGVIEGVKRNVLPRKQPVKAEEENEATASDTGATDTSETTTPDIGTTDTSEAAAPDPDTTDTSETATSDTGTADASEDAEQKKDETQDTSTPSSGG